MMADAKPDQQAKAQTAPPPQTDAQAFWAMFGSGAPISYATPGQGALATVPTPPPVPALNPWSF